MTTAVERMTLEQIAEGYRERTAPVARRLIVCAGTGCVANGSLKLHGALCEAIEKAGLPVVVELKQETPAEGSVHVSRSGCQGFCQQGPLVTILPEGILYGHVHAPDAQEIVDRTLRAGELIERLLYKDPATGKRCHGFDDIPFYQLQQRAVLKECGLICPEDLAEYVSHGGYFGARRAFTEMTSEQVCADVVESGLRGRGGGGFPTGRKWELARVQPGTKKYIVCNGDEGDPGAFMDRSVMEGNPHGLLEGMMIAARAIGADEGLIYVRAEYPLAVKRLRRAVADAEETGLLGDDLFGTGIAFRINMMEGAGAFVCGEETALLASVEGKRGMPMPKPPFPAQKGLDSKPTVINNVETLASVPLILRDGPAAYKSVGTPGSPGTKTFALTGHVANTGLIEVPFGATLREIVMTIGGGVIDKNNRPDKAGFKAVQIGGPSGGCLTQEHLDLPLDFDSLRSVGAMVGSGGLVVMNQRTCMVKVARFFMQFTQNESCGKCVLCREGTKQMLALLDDIIEGNGTLERLELLETVARVVAKGSLCGLGKTAPSPVLSTLRYFRDEYMAHVVDKRCPTGNCKKLARPVIIEEKCKGCTVCIRKCPVNAIEGERKQPHRILQDVCINCGACFDACKLGAIVYN